MIGSSPPQEECLPAIAQNRVGELSLVIPQVENLEDLNPDIAAVWFNPGGMFLEEQAVTDV